MYCDSDRLAGPIVEPIDGTFDLEAVIASFAREPESVILESSQQQDGQGRYSILACEAADRVLETNGTAVSPLGSFEVAQRRWPKVKRVDGSVPLAGGWIGWFSYELGAKLESAVGNAPFTTIPTPLVMLRLFDALAVYDHIRDQWYACAIDWPAPFRSQRPPVEHRLKSIRRRLESASPVAMRASALAGQPRLDQTTEEYFTSVERALRYIAAGDIYQVNLTRRFRADTPGAPLDLYRRLRLVNPSSHAAYLRVGDTTVLSASPELFLDIRDGHVKTRPIKGTAPRTGDTPLDEARRQALAASEKDIAELNMIVDLMRNDLGRICEPGSVRVRDAGTIEAHPTVFHRVATITGRLTSDCRTTDLIKATFPAGSITGAPKIRAMQIIHELEPCPRGVYCGAIGWMGLDGDLSLNVAIRTMTHRPGEVTFFAGGGIVADSTPEAEYEETLAKARGMMRALGCTDTDEPMALGGSARHGRQ